jgi:tetratricopeptide (TPR) repeat protein
VAPTLHLRVERALALVPDADEFRPFAEAVIGASLRDPERAWAGSAVYATLGKRLVDADRLEALVPEVVERTRRRLESLFGTMLQAVRAQQAGDGAGAARALVRAGEAEEAERRLEKAAAIYSLALEIARDLRDKGPQVLASRRLGRVARAAGKLDEARSWYQQSYELAVAQLDPTGEAVACQGLGNVCDDQGLREEAATWYRRGLEAAEGLGQPGLEFPFYANLSVMAMLDGDLPGAERLLEEARSRIETTGTEDAAAFWLNNRGLLLMESGDLAAAEALFREVLERTRDAHWELTARVNLGEVLARQDRLFEAAEEARRAEEIAILHRFITDLVDVYALLGSLARLRRDEGGFVFYEQALEMCREHALPAKTRAGILQGYGQLHLACGSRTEGHAYLEAALELYRTLGFAREAARVEADLVPSPDPSP